MRQSVAALLDITRLGNLLDWLTKTSDIALTFHRVSKLPGDIEPFDSCPAVPVNFFRECLWYLIHRYDVVALTELVQRKGKSRRPRVAVTFDDGWRDNFDLAFEVLQKYRVPATIFMTAGKLGGSQPFWQQRLGYFFRSAQEHPGSALDVTLRTFTGASQSGPLNRDCYVSTVRKWKKLLQSEIDAFLDDLERLCPEIPECRRLFLNEAELRELSRNAVAIGSHTMTHRILTREGSEVVDWELRESKAVLEKITGDEVRLLSYPNGECSPAIEQKATKLGYHVACTTIEGPINGETQVTSVPRIDIGWDRFMKSSGSFSAGLFRIHLARIIGSCK
jgi:peptidoglycan/xylan/chitin deacetylase (PgdA/CDA1 family)